MIVSQNQCSLETRHSNIDRLPMYYAWSLIPAGIRRVYCTFALNGRKDIDDRPWEDINYIADLDWIDIDPRDQVTIMAFLKQSAKEKYRSLQEPGRLKYTPLPKPEQMMEMTELERLWP